MSLAKAPTNNVVINVTSGDNTEGRVKGGNSPTTAADSIALTFTPADWTTPQTVTVVGQGDIEIDGAQSYSVSVAVDGTATLDTEYSVLSTQTVSVTNADTDQAGITVSGNPSPTEGKAAGTFTVKLNTKPTADVTLPITIRTPDQVVIKGGDSPTTYVGTLNLTFLPSEWNTPKTITVQAVDDSVDDGTQTVDLDIGPAVSADSNYNNLPSVTKRVYAYDNDDAGLVISTPSVNTSEPDVSGSFTVALLSEPTANVFVTVSSQDTTEGLVSGGDSTEPVSSITLQFTTQDWSSAQPVTVYGQDDVELDGPIEYLIDVGNAVTTDSSYSSSWIDETVKVKNSDDESGVTETGMTLTLADLPYTSQVALGDTSTYTLSGLATDWKYTLTAANVTDDITLDVKNNGQVLCSSSKTGAKTEESCQFTALAGSAVDVRVGGAGTENGAQFTLSLGQPSYPYTFEVHGDTTTGSYIRLYDSDILDPNTYPHYLEYDSDYQGVSVVTHDLTAGETYYLQVSEDYGPGPYKVQVADTAANLSDFGLAAATVGEPDNDANSAVSLTLNTALERYLIDGDQDWFKFTVPMP